jgi:hypothetical protein
MRRKNQFRLRDDARAATGQFLFDALEDVDVPSMAAEHDCCQKAAHRAPDYKRAAGLRH